MSKSESKRKNLTLLAGFFALAAVGASLPVSAQVVAFDMVGGASQNLTSFVNPYNGAFSSAGDGFQKYQRGVSSTIPFAVLDDSLVIFPSDSLGVIKDGNLDEFFGVTDTENGDNSGPVSATWTFDVSAASGLVLSIDMGAMGDFESSDSFEWRYSIDGGPSLTAFASTVDEAGSFTYTLEGGTIRVLNDPMLVDGTVLSNDLTTFSTPLVGAGSSLSLTLTVTTNGGSEAFTFQNIVITADIPPVVAFDMVGSASQNLTSFVNPYNGAFSSAGDGFQKYQRGVSSTIPFAVLDDSLVIFPGDSLGVIKDGNLDEFFGVTDTENGDNSGPVSATWTFDVSAASGLALSIDMGAMGDFESSDSFEWRYSIDGGPPLTAFASTVDEAGSFTYTLEGGTIRVLNDPMLVDGTVLSNDLTTFSTPLVGAGSSLALTLTATTNGGSEAFTFQNIVLSEGEGPPPPSILEIFEIQGSGSSSPVAGDVITTEENVVTALAANGFFMQTPAARTDGDIDTSDGIFVFTGGSPGVVVGDIVDVSGEVAEFFGFTEINSATVTVSGSGPLPSPVLFDSFVPSPDPTAPSCAIEFECYEGMLIEIPDGTVTGPNQRFSSDTVAEVHITAAPMRTFREPGIEFPGILGLPVWDANPEVFELDPDRLGLPNQVIPAGSVFSATGILGFEFGGYELWPNALLVAPVPLPAPVRPRDSGELTVATLNLFRLFDDLDDPPDGDRDDNVRPTAEYQRRLDKFSAYIREVLDAPDILAVQEVESLRVLEDLATRVESDDATVVYSAFLEEGNDIGSIDVGFLTRDHIQVDAITQLGKGETFVNPITLEDNILHDRPPLLLEGSSQLEFGTFPIAVMTVHNRSLGGIEGSEALRVQQKRYQQAVSIGEKIQELQNIDPDIRLVVLGDFNAFEFSDGYVDAVGIIRGEFSAADNLVCSTNTCVDVVEPDLSNQVLGMNAENRYSFIFQGNAQVLDHALTTTGIAAEISGAEFGRGNADAAVDLINEDTNPLRSSDHDGLVVYVLGDADADGVPNDADLCPGTEIPESVPTRQLNPNHWALTDENGTFDTVDPNGVGPDESFTVGDTAGCSCEQIIEARGLGNGHSKFGCSLGVMRGWVDLVNP